MRTKFFTGEGDKGQSRVGKTRLKKSEPFFDLIGDLDELNSWLGFCGVALQKKLAVKAGSEKILLIAILKRLQEILFVVQAEAAAVKFGYQRGPKVSVENVYFLEKIIKAVDRELPKISKFIISGGSEAASRLDLARATARRAERRAVAFSSGKKLNPPALQFLNRLSSLLFALARYVNYRSGVKEENPSYK